LPFSGLQPIPVKSYISYQAYALSSNLFIMPIYQNRGYEIFSLCQLEGEEARKKEALPAMRIQMLTKSS
jgi:hypothetical protein